MITVAGGVGVAVTMDCVIDVDGHKVVAVVRVREQEGANVIQYRQHAVWMDELDSSVR